MGEDYLAGVFEALYAQPAKSPGGGRAVMFVAARRGEGVSSIVRIAARANPETTTYCIDLDLRRNALARVFSAENAALGPRMDARLNGSCFWRMFTPGGEPIRESSPAYCYHRVGRGRLHVGAFDNRALPANGKVLISGEPDYWIAMRAGGAIGLIDAPALERSRLALRVARHMDGVVLVVGAEAGGAPAAMAAKTELVAAGANLIGLVYNRASAPVMALEKLLRRAG